MNLPPVQPSPPSTTSLLVKGECFNCKFKNRWLLHNVVLRDEDRRVCTSCVLRLHPTYFCPTCFEFYDHPPSASDNRFTRCVKCSSFTHTRCRASSTSSSSSSSVPFLCPPCSQPKTFTFFPVPGSPLDQKLGRVLLCAAKIASVSIYKQLNAAKARADRANQVSAATRKRAKEDLLYCDELKRWNNSLESGSIEVSGSRSVELGIGNNSKEDLNGFIRGQYNQNGSVGVNNINGGNENGRFCNGGSSSMFGDTSKSR